LALSAPELAALADRSTEAAGSARAAIVAVAELTERVVNVRPDAKVLAVWLADAVLAQKF
jgi:hypothetical protein